MPSKGESFTCICIDSHEKFEEIIYKQKYWFKVSFQKMCVLLLGAGYLNRQYRTASAVLE